jgi:isochorismate synthase
MAMHDSFSARRLQQRLDAQFRKQTTAGVPIGGLFSLRLELTDFQLRRLPPLSAPYLYWARPEEGLWQLGLGRAWHTSAAGAQRFDSLGQRLQALQRNWHCRDEFNAPSPGPGLFCALAFAPDDPMTGCWHGLPNSTLFLPRLLLRSEAGKTTVTFSCTGSELRCADAVLDDWSRLIEQLGCALSAPPHDEDCRQAVRVTPEADTGWTEVVQRAIGSINSGQLEKVVSARRVRLRAPQPLRATNVLARLTCRYSSCLLLAVNLGGNTVVSASPERLARLRNGAIRCDALGGTTGRSQDGTRDRKLALRLLNSHKAQHEHRLVVDAIQSALAPLCVDLKPPGAATVVKLHNVQHLWTGIEGRLRNGVSLLEAVRQLQPTPAVAGTPTDKACQWLQDHENLARGWYSGSVGWLHTNGDGDFSVLLRCAVLQGNNADVFAGAGIVADSDPQAELQETEIKLRAMLEAMQEDFELENAPAADSDAGQRVGHS